MAKTPDLNQCFLVLSTDDNNKPSNISFVDKKHIEQYADAWAEYEEQKVFIESLDLNKILGMK